MPSQFLSRVPLAICTKIAFDGSAAWVAASLVTLTSVLPPSYGEERKCGGEIVGTNVARDAPYSRRLAERAHRLPVDTKVVILGDSVAGRWRPQMIDPLLAEHALNFAHGGDRFENTSSMIDQFDFTAARNVKRVISIVGSNSVNRDEPCVLDAKAEALIGKLVHTFSGAQIYIFNIIPKGRTTGPMDDRVRRTNALLQKLATKYGLRYVDIYAPFSRRCERTSGCPYYESDGVHPSEEGYRLIADAFSKTLGK